MDLIVADWETYYDDEYSLSKMTTEAYIRDPRFEALILGYKVNDQPRQTAGGPVRIREAIERLDIPNNALVCHHAHFDGLIFSHHFGVKPKMWFDTLSMARAIHGTEVGGSLGKLIDHYNALVPGSNFSKGSFVLNAKGKHLDDFSTDEWWSYREYCGDDVDGTRFIFDQMLPHIPKPELRQIDWVIRMFTEPRLYIDEAMLREYVTMLRGEKVRLLLQAGVQEDELMSNMKFAEALKRLDIVPPMKTSKTTGGSTFAFAKTDHGMQVLLEHEDPAVQALVAARLGVKSTMNETRAERMADMATRGAAPIYYKYYGAMQTGRLSGGDSMNWQNLTRGSALRDAIYAGEGEIIPVADSSNIEARILDWLAQQEDMMEVYRRADRKEGPDIYCVMASSLYEREVTPSMPKERQDGKVVKLASGYQMGHDRLKETARSFGVHISIAEAARWIQIYRERHPMVVNLWKRAQDALPVLMEGPLDGASCFLDGHGLVKVVKGALLLPNGLSIRYPNLKYERGTAVNNWTYQAGRERTNIYGGKIVENIVQALARIAVMDQTMQILKRYPVVMHSHDEVVMCVPEEEGNDALAYAIWCMSQSPAWAPGLPLFAKGGIARRYGEAKT